MFMPFLPLFSMYFSGFSSLFPGSAPDISDGFPSIRTYAGLIVHIRDTFLNI